MINELKISSRQELFPLWEPIDWPSITCGGPVSLHQARHECVQRLPSLHRLDPSQFPLPNLMKATFWRWGHSEQDCSKPIQSPVTQLGLQWAPKFYIAHSCGR